jgi:hypothetical protein
VIAVAPSARLRAKLDLALPALWRVADRLWSSPRLAQLYPEYLCTMHAIVRSSVPLMEAALARARELEADDDVAAAVAAYLAKHMREEAGHDRWILQDLEATGGDPEEPLRRIPTPEVAAVVGAQYYWLRHYHPVSLLGHVAVMEGYPPGSRLATVLAERTGYGADAFRSIRRHAHLDIRHRDELYEAIDAVPFREEHEQVVGLSALATVQGLVAVFSGLLRRNGESP